MASGVKTTDAAIDLWEKELAPSGGLRRWFDYDRARWEEFRLCYEAELRERPGEVERLRALARQAPITLVFSGSDKIHSSAVVLRDLLLRGGRGQASRPAPYDRSGARLQP
jgi:uncharacterized protein YeaO (DUF488 family)